MASHEQTRMHELIRDSPPWWQSSKLVQLYFLLLPALLTSSAWGFDISMTNGLQSIPEFSKQFDNPEGSRLGFYGASSSIGGLCAVFIWPFFVDITGRRLLVFIGALLVVAMSIMETFSTSFYMFAAGKLLLGFGSLTSQIVAPVLVVELAHPKQRQAISSLYNTSLYIGLIIGAWIAYGTAGLSSTWAWRIPAILQTALPTYQVLTIWFCPESPRWLASRGRLQAAQDILIKYHGQGRETDLVQFEIRKSSRALSRQLNREGFRTVLSTRGNLHRLWMCAVTAIASQCCGSQLVANYLPQILDQVGFSSTKEKTLMNGLIFIASWLSAIAAAFTIPYVPRRSVFLSSTGLMLVLFTIWTALAAEYVKTSSKSIGIGVVAMVFLFNMTYCACWVPLVIAYPLEIATTKQRAVFFCWVYICINASSTAVTYINPIGLQDISWRYYIIQTIFIALVFIAIYFTFVETQGRDSFLDVSEANRRLTDCSAGYTLEEIAVLFDGQESFDRAMVDVAVGVGKQMELDDGRKASVVATETVESKDA
ncbi:hypothetical protein BAUCODRAFT_80285 [Baudoinia panamericana UAMH 10762]|uniref:Major facilitator superfamily (MFS) profile domain-containing protein n=1 Tax=Baudoinia panamericana (strain UAMH 10762) TaxID=717646 RepID=M2M417_BAUPA|nr:uncharacterized protein BAUCODRAFT_80285 [Baudoinia panamericana UAMH 10762]EMC91326.1 hypothetical protein BAUCODRAFT_80285 [Baudoinia panamericana UAMH 10762]